MALRKVTTSEFKKEVQEDGGRVVVDFYADWCGPCHLVAPALEKVSARWSDTVRFVRVDIDENPELARRYNVFSIPTIVLFQDGEVAAQIMGARPAHEIERELGLVRHDEGDSLPGRASP